MLSSNAIRVVGAVALTTLSTVASSGQPAIVPTVADLPVSTGGRERVFFIAVPQPRATVILLTGGQGRLAIDDAGAIRPDRNFLVRTRALWAARGFNVAVPGPPNGGSLLGQRHTAAYRAALDAVVGYARSRANVPVWIFGTSQGAIGAVNGAHLAPAVAGIVVTSPVTVRGSSGETVFDAEPETVAVPALVVANSGDGCVVTPPGGAARLLAALTGAPRKELIVVESHEGAATLCSGEAPHGYFGIEAEVVRRIADWIVSVPAH